MSTQQAAREIALATTRADLRKAYRAYIGRRRNYCILGPEYFGCINSGSRAMIQRTKAGYLVGKENETWRDLTYYPVKEGKRAFSKFIGLAWKTQEFNLRSRAEVKQARAAVATGDPRRMVNAALTLSDHGLTA